MDLEEEKYKWSVEMDKWGKEAKRLSKIAQVEIKSKGKVNDGLMKEISNVTDKFMECGDKLVEIAEMKENDN
jgi:hypothetical protein|tara:strand:+ start:693 stop:908 length:216 start_codon:yes stop_codon:yes gene_type:complete